MQRQIAEDFVMPAIDPRFDPLATLDNSQTVNLYASDHKLFVSFYTKPVLNPLKSTEAGRQVFDEVDYIRIVTPGSLLSIIDTPVDAGNYMQRFGDKYAKWKAAGRLPVADWQGGAGCRVEGAWHSDRRTVGDAARQRHAQHDGRH